MAAKAKAATKKTAKAPAKKAAKTARASKAVAKKVTKPAAKPTKKPVAKAVAAKKQEPVKAPARFSPGRPPKIQRPPTVPVPASTVVPSVRIVTPKAQPVASPRDLAAAHEYLLNRSAGRHVNMSGPIDLLKRLRRQ